MAKKSKQEQGTRSNAPVANDTTSNGTAVPVANQGRDALPTPRNRAEAQSQIKVALQRNLKALRALSKL